MKRFFGVLVGVAVVAVAGLAFAQMGGGTSGMGGGMMGSGMMGGGGMMGSGMMGGGDAPNAPALTEDRAREAAQQYVDAKLPGFTIETVQPFTGMHGTMYSVEVKGPKGEVEVLHVNPWGNVMPGHGRAGRTT